MPRHTAENERIKRIYFTHLKLASGFSEASIDAAAKAIHRFESSTGFRSLKKFHIQQAIAFRRRLDEAVSARDGKPLSKATVLQTLNLLRAFFLWLAEQPGYRRHVRYSDAEYFRQSEKDTRIAKAPRERLVPTPEQIESVLQAMAGDTAIERRNRAIIAFTWLTGMRDGALASLKVKHVHIDRSRVDQNPREVRTKNSKALLTTFFPVGGSALQIVTEWIDFLITEKLWGLDDPAFPATLVQQGPSREFLAAGLSRNHWHNATPIRRIFKEAFEIAGFPAFNPHSFRHALAILGERMCKTPEEFKAWSQNLGHDRVLTTLTSYGRVQDTRQAEIIRMLGSPGADSAELDAAAKRIVMLARLTA